MMINLRAPVHAISDKGLTQLVLQAEEKIDDKSMLVIMMNQHNDDHHNICIMDDDGDNFNLSARFYDE